MPRPSSFSFYSHFSVLEKLLKPRFCRTPIKMFAALFRTRAKHKRLPQHEAESLDSDILLPSSSSSTSLTIKPIAFDRSSRDLQVAVRTLLLCTIVYVGATLWIAWSVHQTEFVADPDEFCLHHVSLYCKLLQSRPEAEY